MGHQGPDPHQEADTQCISRTRQSRAVRSCADVRHGCDVVEVAEKRDTGYLKNGGSMTTNTTSPWEQNIIDLEHDLQYENFSDFLHWAVVKRTMFLGNSPYIAVELFYLVTHNWNLWKRGIEEDRLGNPTPFILCRRSSGNLIHHAYHLAKFMDATKQDVRDFDTVFEFGGGYGSMARLFHNIGFDGEYVIYDIPQFSLLQQRYLKSIGKDDRVTCISDVDHIPEFDGRTLFIGTWSLSEAPVQLRDEILAKVGASSYLMAYQGSFDSIDNCAYFNTIMHREKKTIEWYNPEIKHISGDHYYLFGVESNIKEVAYHARH